MSELSKILSELKSLANPEVVKGMARFGINPENCLGITIPTLRALAKKTGKNHKLALELYKVDLHEGKTLACYIDDYKEVTEKQMEDWVLGFNSWDVCDQTCSNLFDKTPFAYQKALDWSKRDEEFVKRAGFVLMAVMAVHDKKMDNSRFDNFFEAIVREANDNRNFVKKAVNWALRQIGKRNKTLNKKAVELSLKIESQNTKSAKWIAKNAYKELIDPKIVSRLKDP